tara:strand:+ start:1284 stop:1547 length:264 start_codon:yes stop_codon:yes gene_type:complete
MTSSADHKEKKINLGLLTPFVRPLEINIIIIIIIVHHTITTIVCTYGGQVISGCSPPTTQVNSLLWNEIYQSSPIFKEYKNKRIHFR